MDISSYDLISVNDFTTVQNYSGLLENTGKLVIAGVNMIPVYSVSLASEQTVAGYTFTTAGESLSSTAFASSVSSIVSVLGYIGIAITIILTINSYLSSMWAVDSLKRQRDKFLTMFRKIKRLNRIADINKIAYENLKLYLDNKYKMLENYEKQLNDNNYIVKDFISAKTNTFLLSNPIQNFLQNEQNVLNILSQNNYKYINVVSFIDYDKNINMFELDKVRIANADTQTLKTYIDNLNAILIITDKFETMKLFDQVVNDINYIKNNVNKLLNEIKKTYVEQVSNQNIDNPLQMLIEITNDIPFLDLSAQTQDIGGLSLYPAQYIANDIPILFNTLNKKDLMILVFNNIYIKKFINLMISFYQTEKQLQQDTLKYISNGIKIYNILNEIIGLKILKEKNFNQHLPNNVYVDRYRIFTYIKKIFIKKTQYFLSTFSFKYKKLNNVNVRNSLYLDDKIYDIEQYFYNKDYDFNDFLYYFEFNTQDKDQQINNINLDTIEMGDFETQYFSYINDIVEELKKYSIDITKATDEMLNKIKNMLWSKYGGFRAGAEFYNNQEYFQHIHITSIYELVYYIIYVLTYLQIEIDKSYEQCNFVNYEYNFNKLTFNEKITEQKQTTNIRIKDCILIGDIVDKNISELESQLYQLRQEFKYEYSVFSDLFLSEQSYFLFELFTKVEQITNSSIGLIKDTQLSVNNAGYNINFYEIMFEFFTKYLNNYSGYIYSKNKYLDKLTNITQSNFVSVLQIACNYKPIDVKVEDLNKSNIEIISKTISQTELKNILELSNDITTSDILSNTEIKQPDIKDNSTTKLIATVLSVALLSN